jgi:hypothetical protein
MRVTTAYPRYFLAQSNRFHPDCGLKLFFSHSRKGLFSMRDGREGLRPAESTPTTPPQMLQRNKPDVAQIATTG